MDTMFFLTSEEGEEQKCIGCLFFTSKKYSGPIGYICPYTIDLHDELGRPLAWDKDTIQKPQATFHFRTRE